MMKSEFEILVDRPINDEEYSTIECVYTWHPAIREVDGKAQIARLYTDYGMTVIEDMVERSGQMEKLDTELKEALRQVTVIKDRIKIVRGVKS